MGRSLKWPIGIFVTAATPPLCAGLSFVLHCWAPFWLMWCLVTAEAADLTFLSVKLKKDKSVPFKSIHFCAKRRWPRERMRLLWGSCIPVSEPSAASTRGLEREPAWCRTRVLLQASRRFRPSSLPRPTPRLQRTSSTRVRALRPRAHPRRWRLEEAAAWLKQVKEAPVGWSGGHAARPGTR